MSEALPVSPPAARPAFARSRETLTAVIMTRNSASLVEGTLESVAGWADEIVVVDGFSTDHTVEICRRFGARVVQNRWDGYRFATERNLGTSLATSDWCLHIDPDERATKSFKEAVHKVLSESTRFDAFQFRKKNYFLGHPMRFGGWYHYSLHLFRRGKAHYDGIIHEKLIVEGEIGKIEAPIEHFPYPTIRLFVGRHNGYSSREAAMILEERGRVPESEVLSEIRRKPLKRFRKFYLKKFGFLDGYTGLVFSVLYAWVHFVNWAKFWEMTYGKEVLRGKA